MLILANAQHCIVVSDGKSADGHLWPIQRVNTPSSLEVPELQGPVVAGAD